MEYKYSLTNINLIQETPEIDHFHDRKPEGNDNDDALSLCDLPLHDDGENDLNLQRHSSTTPPDFEFSTTQALHNAEQNILFFGKSIHDGNRPQTTSSIKLHRTKPSPVHLATAVTHPPPTPTPSRSARLPEIGKLRYQSSTLKQYHVLIGLGAKFDPPQMLELGEMRKRQTRKAPSPMFSGFGSEQPGGKGHGGSLRPFRLRSNLVRALTGVSFGCPQHV